MSTTQYATNTPRIGKLKGEILGHVQPVEILGKYGLKKPMPKNSSETMIFRRWLPRGATVQNPNIWNVQVAGHQLSEGETPTSESIVPQDIPVSLVEYGFVYRWTNRVEELYEDDVPPEIKRIAGERMGLLLEMIRWGTIKAATNVFRSGNVASRSLVVGLINPGLLRLVGRSLAVNQASKITSILSASTNIGTEPVEAAWVAICHTDLDPDIRSQLPGFVHVSEYGSRTVMHEQELGSWEQWRFLCSPHLGPYLQAGGTSAAANTRLSNGVPNVNGTEACDVYPVMVMGMDCFGDVALRGVNAMKVNHKPAGESTKDDILGQKGVMGMRTYFSCVRLNEGHMAVLEVAASALQA